MARTLFGEVVDYFVQIFWLLWMRGRIFVVFVWFLDFQKTCEILYSSLRSETRQVLRSPHRFAIAATRRIASYCFVEVSGGAEYCTNVRPESSWVSAVASEMMKQSRVGWMTEDVT